MKKKLFLNIATDILIMILLVAGWEMIFRLVVEVNPNISNDIAMGQFENSNFNFTLLTKWNKTKTYVFWAQIGTIFACIFSILRNIIKYKKY